MKRLGKYKMLTPERPVHIRKLSPMEGVLDALKLILTDDRSATVSTVSHSSSKLTWKDCYV